MTQRTWRYRSRGSSCRSACAGRRRGPAPLCPGMQPVPTVAGRLSFVMCRVARFASGRVPTAPPAPSPVGVRAPCGTAPPAVERSSGRTPARASVVPLVARAPRSFVMRHRPTRRMLPDRAQQGGAWLPGGDLSAHARFAPALYQRGITDSLSRVCSDTTWASSTPKRGRHMATSFPWQGCEAALKHDHAGRDGPACRTPATRPRRSPLPLRGTRAHIAQ